MLMDVKKEKLYYQENTIGSINYELNSQMSSTKNKGDGNYISLKKNSNLAE